MRTKILYSCIFFYPKILILLWILSEIEIPPPLHSLHFQSLIITVRTHRETCKYVQSDKGMIGNSKITFSKHIIKKQSKVDHLKKYHSLLWFFISGVCLTLLINKDPQNAGSVRQIGGEEPRGSAKP